MSKIVVYRVLDENGDLLSEYDDAYRAIHHAVRRAGTKQLPVIVQVVVTDDV